MNKSILNFNGLPNGWTNAKLYELVINPKNDIVDGPFGSNLHASEYVNDGVPLVRLQNIDRNKFINKNIRYITIRKSQELQRHNYNSNDILITKLGEPLGKACLVPENIQSGIIVADVVRMRVNHNNISKKYITYCINSPTIINQFPRPKGSTRPRVNLNHIREIEIPIAPLKEQKRIVSKLEELFTKLDAGIEYLKKNQILLKQYRQSVLKQAFEGKLTEKWRKENSSLANTDSILDK